MKKYQGSRRDFIYLCIGGGGLLVTGYPLLAKVISQSGDEKSKQSFTPTPSNSLGPFYKKGAPRRDKLTAQEGDPGVPLLVAGQVINTDGKPLSDANIEVFHADHHGNYDMEGFRYRGVIPATRTGEYRFETIRPGQYGGRAQHIHYMISAPGHRRLVTQLYFANDPMFEGNPDQTYTKDNLVEHRELIRPVTLTSMNSVSYSSVVFNICLEKA